LSGSCILQLFTATVFVRSRVLLALWQPDVFKAGNWPAELHIARALLIGPIDREPQMHGFYDTHVEWVVLSDNLPRKSAPEST
jgi:hypothetical protein